MNEAAADYQKLRIAMANADIEEIEAAADAIGVEAVHKALTEAEYEGKTGKLVDEMQRQRDLDGALADVIEVCNRHRTRLGRRGVSRHDGETIRRMFELLRAMQPENGTDALR